jgi:ADP-heptose:LPS heptosyltransferase
MISSAKLPLPDAPRLLVVRPDRVGDVIISTSCIGPIRDAFPRGQLHFFAAEPMRPLLDGHPKLAGFVSNPAKMSELHLDAVVHLHPDEACYRAAARTCAPIRIGYAVRSLNRFLTHPLADERSAGVKHEAAYNFDLLRLLGVAQPPQLSANVHLPESNRATLQAKLPWALDSTRFAVLNPSAHSKVARWPAEYFSRLADLLRNDRGLQVVVIGADGGDSLPPLGGEYVNLAGKTDLGELGWLLKHARVLVSRDTGPSHLAAAVGCPVVVIFGRTAPLYGPTRWRPLTEKAVIVARSLARRPLERRDAYWRRCFAAISVDEVYEAVQQALSMREPRG